MGALLRTLRGNRASAARVAGAFLEDCPRVARALRGAVRGGDAAEVARLAHRLKGNAGILRAGGVRDAVAALERSCADGDLAPAEERLVELEHQLALLCDALGAFLADVERASPAAG